MKRRISLPVRDLEVIRWVYTVGVAKREHVQTMFFGPGSRSRCQYRLTLLFRNGYLDRWPDRNRNRPDVYSLTRRSRNGLSLLRALGIDNPQPLRVSVLRLQHTLDVVGCRALITRACRETGVTLIHWLSTGELVGPMAGTAILPDAYFQLSRLGASGEEKKSAYFLEVERSDKAERTLIDKFRRLGAFYYGGDFARRFGLRALRVLVVVGSDYGIRPERRVERLATLAERAGVTFLRFAPLADFLATSPAALLWAPIWRRPGVAGTVPLFPTENHGELPVVDGEP